MFAPPANLDELAEQAPEVLAKLAADNTDATETLSDPVPALQAYHEQHADILATLSDAGLTVIEAPASMVTDTLLGTDCCTKC